MGWESITVGKFQHLECLTREYDTADAAASSTLDVRIVALLNDMTEDEVNSLSLSHYQRLASNCEFIDVGSLPSTPQQFISVNGRRYRMIYDVREIRARVYIETKTFESEGIIANLHKIAASMAVPQAKTRWGYWKGDATWQAERHEEYANDFKDAKLSDVYGSVVFFCRLFEESMTALQPFIHSELIQKGMKKEQANRVLTALSDISGGLMRQPQ